MIRRSGCQPRGRGVNAKLHRMAHTLFCHPQPLTGLLPQPCSLPLHSPVGHTKRTVQNLS